jgi:iron complex outermembrane receptor protein
LKALLTLVLGAALPYIAVGQTAPTASTTETTSPPAMVTTTTTTTAKAPEQEVKLEKFVVTGSYIPAALDEAKALPVQVIDIQAIQLTGINTNVLDVLRKTVPQIQGGNNIGLENGNIAGNSTNGGSRISLRNVDTLVLIDGKRVASSGVAASGGYEFVDLNLVPLAAVERIEVLTDGASAIYGSDAVSGVVNIILRKDYQGAEIDSHFENSPNDTGGFWRQRSISVTAGGGDAKTHLMFSAEWTKSQPIWERDVNYDNQYFATTSYPGVVSGGGNYYKLAPGLNAPPAVGEGGPTTMANLVARGVYVQTTLDDVINGFNLSGKPTIQNSVDKRIATVSGTHEISDQITLKADFLYANSDTNYQLNPQPVTAPNKTLLGYGVSPISDTNLTIRNRFIFGPNRIYDNQTNFYRATAELDGKVNDYFNWQVYANYNISYQTALGFNQILNSALLSGIQSGLINLFAIQQDPANLTAANIFGTSIADYTSQLYTYDALINGKIWDLPAGPLQYAAGVEYRNESLKAIADYNSTIPVGETTSLWNNGVSVSPFASARNVKSEFVELKVPIFSPQNGIPGLHLLTLDGAYRHEDYSDGNKSTVPKVSIRYLPYNDELALRATFSKSFEEPMLYDLYGPSNSGFTNSPGGLTAYNSSGVAIGPYPQVQGQEMSGSNSLLKPAKAKGSTYGVVYSPRYAKGLEISVDYYKIDQTDLIGNAATDLTMMQSVEQYGPASPFAQYIALGGFPGQGGTAVTAPGQLSKNPDNVFVLQSLLNIATQNQHGWDVNLKYTLPWQAYGRVTINSNWAIMRQFFLKSSPIDPGFDYSGYDLYGTLPKTRSYSTVDWDYKAYGATLGYTHINNVNDGYGDTINPYNTFDVQFRLNLGQLSSHLSGFSFDVGVNNFTNQKPPLDRNNFSSPPFDASTYSFFGRSYYMDLRYKF